MIARNNPADKYDFVLKADLLCVVAPDVLKRFFSPSQIVDAQSCLSQVDEQLLKDYRDMQKKWYGAKS
jgi:hypothetical protein